MHLVPIPRRPVDWKQIWASPVRLSVTQGADQTTAIQALQCCLGSGLPGLEAARQSGTFGAHHTTASKALQCCLGSGLPVRQQVWPHQIKKISHFHASSLERQSLCSCMILAMMNAQETVNGIQKEGPYTCCWACYLGFLESG